MTLIKFVIPGQPVGQGRPRVVHRGRYVHAFDPPKSRYYKRTARLILMEVYQGKPLAGPVRVTVRAFFKIPKSYTKKKKKACLSGQEKPTKKPDIDNIIKGVMDACNGYAYLDDKQVVEVQMSKQYAAEPKVVVEIEELGDEPNNND